MAKKKLILYNTHHLVLERREARAVTYAAGTTADPVLLEVFNNLFMNIAEQMGLQLQNTAYSVNIKERLDFSCALFDAEGNLIANAPHMPVHLGSMGESIKTVIRENAGRMQRGDVYALNDPYHGGTHLPDVTVITPVYLDEAPEPIFYVGSRGHHADIGGISPGSMPPFSTRIEQEGVQINNVKLVDGGSLREQEMLALLASGEYPSRNPQQNMADLKAQIAANEKGVQELRKMVEHRVEHLRVVRLPVLELRHDAQWLAGSVGPCGVTGKSLVRQIRVVLEGAHGVHDVDVPAAGIPGERGGQFGSPHGRLDRG